MTQKRRRHLRQKSILLRKKSILKTKLLKMSLLQKESLLKILKNAPAEV
jgi:uncharacterized protein